MHGAMALRPKVYTFKVAEDFGGGWRFALYCDGLLVLGQHGFASFDAAERRACAECEERNAGRGDGQ